MGLTNTQVAGRLGVSLNAPDTGLATPHLRARHADNAGSGTTVLGVEWESAHYTGGNLSLYNSGGCAAGAVGFPSLNAYGWNDKISSAQLIGGCSNDNHFQNDSYKNSQSGWPLDCTSSNNCYNFYGTQYNDQTSSILFT